MDPADFEMVGVLGKLCVSIREGGTGELIYSQMGTRRVCGARSDDGGAMAKGTEVVVTRYEKGIAYVRLWSEMSGALDEASTSEDDPQATRPGSHCRCRLLRDGPVRCCERKRDVGRGVARRRESEAARREALEECRVPSDEC